MSEPEKYVPLPDPLIDEIRAIRKSLSDRFGDDWKKYGEYIRQVEYEYRTKTGRFKASDTSISSSKQPN